VHKTPKSGQKPPFLARRIQDLRVILVKRRFSITPLEKSSKNRQKRVLQKSDLQGPPRKRAKIAHFNTRVFIKKEAFWSAAILISL